MQNILFESSEPTSNLKIIDFGFSCRKPDTAAFGEQSASKALKTPCFTLNYAAPEVLDTAYDSSGYNEMCDLWSLGVILVCECRLSVRLRAATAIGRVRIDSAGLDYGNVEF